MTPPATGVKVEGKKAVKPEAAKLDLKDLEEDDDFEEFPADDYGTAEPGAEEEIKVWEDNWDDDNVEEDFSSKLRKESVEMDIRGGAKNGTGNPPPAKKKK